VGLGLEYGKEVVWGRGEGQGKGEVASGEQRMVEAAAVGRRMAGAVWNASSKEGDAGVGVGEDTLVAEGAAVWMGGGEGGVWGTGRGEVDEQRRA